MHLIRGFALRASITLFILLFLAPNDVTSRCWAQASGGSVGGSSGGALDPFGTTVNDSVSFNTKSDTAAKSEVGAGASLSWVFGCIEPTALPVSDQASGKPYPPGSFRKCQQQKNSLGNHNVEIQSQAGANYDDTWKTVPSSSTVVQQYSGAFNLLWNDGRPEDPKPPIKEAAPYVFLSRLVHAPGSVISLSESHDNSQGIVSNTKLGAGLYWRPLGTLQNVDENYLLVSAQAQLIKTESYGNGWKPVSFGLYETVKYRAIWGQFVDGKNYPRRNELDISENLTVPTTDSGTRLQGAFDIKYSYNLASFVGKGTLALSLEELDTYYGPGLVGGPIAQENASAASIGLTFKFKDESICAPVCM